MVIAVCTDMFRSFCVASDDCFWVCIQLYRKM